MYFCSPQNTTWPEPTEKQSQNGPNRKYFFQVGSDFHLEKKPDEVKSITDFLTPVAPNLILAGDIGSLYYEEQLATFLRSCKKHYDTVIFVAGNNEYYTREGCEPKTFSELNAVLEDVCRNVGVILLNNSYIETESMIIFGSTWWSHIPDMLNMKIYTEPGIKITPADFNLWHAVARKSLEMVLRDKGTKPILVITHYCPTKLGTMNMYHKTDAFKQLVPYYFSASEKYLRGQVDTWIYGHTHVFRDFLFNGTHTRIVSNADPRKKFFRSNFVIQFPH